jgi:hypothetical protein
MVGLTTPLEGLKAHVATQMLESEKLPLKNLQMQRSMLLKARVNSRNEDALLSQKENTT